MRRQAPIRTNIARPPAVILSRVRSGGRVEGPAVVFPRGADLPLASPEEILIGSRCNNKSSRRERKRIAQGEVRRSGRNPGNAGQKRLASPAGAPEPSLTAPLWLGSMWNKAIKRLLLAAFLAGPAATWAQQPATAAPVVLDRVVAVVNQHAILASELDDEIRLSVLDPNGVGRGQLTRQQALEQIVSRTLIEQQIPQEDMQAIEPSPEEVGTRLDELRKQLPACVHQNCASDAGWKAFLAAHELTPERVGTYLRYRLEILRFIEQRFRQGIQISPQQIESYYRDTLLPQYTPGEAVPPLDQVAPRIQEILLQQQVNVLFDNWLTNLRQQGDVEVLDPKLESADALQSPQRGEP